MACWGEYCECGYVCIYMVVYIHTLYMYIHIYVEYMCMYTCWLPTIMSTMARVEFWLVAEINSGGSGSITAALRHCFEMLRRQVGMRSSVDCPFHVILTLYSLWTTNYTEL